MGIFSWVQSRMMQGGRAAAAAAAESRGLAAGNASTVAAVVVAAGKERSHQYQQVVPEDLAGDDRRLWSSSTPAPSHLFSIGTLGNDQLPEEEEEDLPEFSVEEVRKLQDALARLLLRARSKKSEAVAAVATAAGGAGADSGLPLDKFLNCPSSLELDRRAQRDHGGGLSPDTKMILTKAKDLLVDGNTTTTSNIKNKSFKFLLKKVCVCHGGCFVPAPSLKDPTESTMEKFLRTVLGRKFSARPSSSPAARAYFLEGKKARGDRRRRRHRGDKDDDDDEEENKGGESCKWDRTDSEYIVLEI
ncbi:protein NEGATIVE GRAVITROPIC RESPONSE OF ROOTS-like [Oryza brachyantha]|uniref:protein NEGATIVE GRAVITROPIC RESPONSE OF ROOTS-like n=1 Tax=Oryza brachyantha TaxID=4533 RepID=UPI001AD9649B|nr:protein NEGATIVE GRAVITROPIC RESPONSE OF ROOTS-like [Oryza brachyantha]